ncbi:nSTAND1 domain-containing NTPase [Nonomuraea gerenzanensis]|uniref:nSTAND1 domain-containing NTPase n=1 Tax=Nonomuraea gerenzanensis TaxID=93944 RepID=UPI0037CC7ADD
MDPLAGPVERLAWELRRLRDEAGRPSYRVLAERAHFSRSTLAEAATGTRLPTLEATLAYAVACGGDPAEWERKWQLAAAELERSQRRCPYPGLLPLDVDAADLFFGRDDLLEVLLKAVQQGPLTVVRGATGSGKSSLLRAGLAARLTAEGTTVTLLTPGAHPLSRLYASGTDSADAGASDADGTAADGTNASDADASTADASTAKTSTAKTSTAKTSTAKTSTADRADANGAEVVIIDQFEETFTLCTDERERAAFLDALSDLVSRQDGPVLVIGIRTDFYDRCASHPGLAAALLDSLHLPVGPMSEQDLRAIITEPAARAGLSVDPDLVVTVVAEAAEQKGALPMVAHALRETWSRQRGDTLTLADYRAVGGVSGAIARTAEHLYADLEADQQQLLRAVLLRLVASGSGSSDTRRGLDRDELAGIGPAGELDAVLDRLAAARLVVVDQDLVDIAHEALLTGWPRLREWLTADRETLLRHQRLTSDAAEWDRNGRGEDYLYRGTRLAQWDGEASFVPLNELERTFLAACRSSAAERDRARRRTRLAFGGLPVAAVVVIVLAALVLVQVNDRDVERDRATSVRLAAEARRQLQQDPELALLLAIEAYEVEPTSEADLVLRQATADSRLRGSTPVGLRRVTGTTATPDGRKIAIWGAGAGPSSLEIWSLDGAAPRRAGHPLQPDRTDGILSAAFSADGRQLVTGDAGGELVLWDLASSGPPVVLGTVDGSVQGVSIRRDGTVASAHSDGVRIWKPGRAEPVKLSVPGGAVRSVAFSPSGRLLATGGNGSPLRLWDMTRDRPVLQRAATRGQPEQTVISPGGPWVATVEGDVPQVWDATEEPAGDWIPQVELAGHDPELNGVVFAADGDRLATFGADGVIRVWTTGSDADPLVLRSPKGNPRGAAFTPDGKSLVSVDVDGSLRTWDVTAGDPAPSRGRPLALSADTSTVAVSAGATSLLTPGDVRIKTWRGATQAEVSGPRDAGYLVALSPDGRRMAGVGRAGTLSLWDLTTAGPPVTTPAPLRGIPISLVFSADGKRIVAGAHGTEPQAWQVSPSGGLTALTGWQTPPTGRADGDVALSSDGTRLADARDDHTVVVWDLTGESEPKILRGHAEDITGLAFSPDGLRLAAAAADGAIRLWDLDGRGEPAGVLYGAENTVRRVHFSPDGTWLVTNEPAGHLRLWRAAGGGEPLELTGWGASGGLVAFSPDGTRIVRGLSPQIWLGRSLITGLGGSLVQSRPCEVCGPSGTVLELARSRRTRELTAEERRSHLGPNS